MKNLYQPYIMKIEEIIEETHDVKTFKLVFEDDKLRESFDYKAGQFGEYSVLGVGEATFCVASSPTKKGYIECSVKRVGKVTNAMHDMEIGDVMGFRGPYGNCFPLEEMQGKNLLFIAGGIGLAPIRSLFWNCLDTRKDFKEITMIYGSRTTSDLVYKHELKEWGERDDLTLYQCIDWRFGEQGPIEASAEDGWIPLNLKNPMESCLDKSNCFTGFVPQLVEASKISPENTIAIVCGPPIMIKFTVQVLAKMGFADEDIITTLEMKMKCGVGKCGRCNIGNIYVCKHGPVFNYKQIKEFPEEF